MKRTRWLIGLQLGLGLIFVGLGHYHMALLRTVYPLDGPIYYGLALLCFGFAWRTARREPNAVWLALADLWREAARLIQQALRDALSGARQAWPYITWRAVVIGVVALNVGAALGLLIWPTLLWVWIALWGVALALLVVGLLPRSIFQRSTAAVTPSTARTYLETVAAPDARLNPWGLASVIGAVLLGQVMMLMAARTPQNTSALAQAIDEAWQLRLGSDGSWLWPGVLLLLGGTIGFAVVTRRAVLADQPGGAIVQAGQVRQRMTWWALAALGGLGLWFLALRAIAQPSAEALAGVLPWLMALVVLGACWWQIDRVRGVRLRLSIERREALQLGGAWLLMLAVFTFQLGNIPNSLWGDEGAFFTTARDISQGTALSVFGFGAYYQPALPALAQSLFLNIFGQTVTAWRLASVLAMALAALPLYLLVRAALGRRTAWLTLLFYTTSPYVLTYARLGYDAAFAVLPVVMALALLWLAVHRDSRFYAFLAGGVAGLSFFVPAGARIAPLLVLLWLVWWWLTRRVRAKPFGRQLAAVVVGLLLVATPTIVYGLAQAPDAYIGKQFESSFNNVFYARDFYPEDQLLEWSEPISAGTQQLFYHPALYGALAVRGAARTALAFHLPTLVSENYLIGALADPFGVLYLLGVAWCLARFRRPAFALWPVWLILGGWLTSALSAFPPRAALLLPIVPALATLSALGLTALVDVIAQVVGGVFARVKPYVLIGLALLLAALGLRAYFVEMPRHFPPDLDNAVFWEAQNLPRGADLTLIQPDGVADDYVPWGVQQFDLGVKYRLLNKADLPTVDWSALCATKPCRFVYVPADRKWVEPYLAQIYGSYGLREISGADGSLQVVIAAIEP